MIFVKENTEHRMFVLIFSTNLLWKISRSTKNSFRYYHTCTHTCLQVKYLAILFRF